MSEPLTLGELKLRELVNQKNFYMEAAIGINSALSSTRTGTAAIFRDIHSLLTHAGNISKLLWGSGKRAVLYKGYRRELGVQEREWLLQSRTLRNALEHYDERLESWGNRNIVLDLNVGPKQALHIDGPEVIFDRHFDPETMTFSIRDDCISLQELTNEVVEIGALAQTRIDQLWDY